MALIKLNRTKTGAVPKKLADGELFIDQLNGKLYWADATGRIKTTILTGEFPAGTIMIFRQTSAPPGWTKLTTNDDSILRVVTGAVSAGGATNFSDLAKQSPVTGGTALTEAQMPAHTHAVTDPGHTHVTKNVYTWVKNGNSNPYYTPTEWKTQDDTSEPSKTGITIASAGGGQAHTHSIPGLNIKYTDVIIASKN